MERIQIPETATETYLHHLGENIHRQLERTKNKKVREHLESMLHEVQEHMERLRRKTEQFLETAESDSLDVLELTDAFEEETLQFPVAGQPLSGEPQAPPQTTVAGVSEDDDVLLLTDSIEEEAEQLIADASDLPPNEQEIVKARLRQALSTFHERKEAAPQATDSMLLSDIIQEIGNEAPTGAQQSHIKDRLQNLLANFQARQEPGTEEAPAEKNKRPPRRGMGSAEEEDELSEEEFAQELRKEKYEFHPITNDPAFIMICQQISQGESWQALKDMKLSEREQDLVNAFLAHFSSYKGLKKQQIFEMQHLTARSIHELDLIFKTYHIQGYLKAELVNVYNRLLNLRSRFSILLH